MLRSDPCLGALRVVTFLDDSVSLLISSFNRIKALLEARLTVSLQIGMIYICMYGLSFFLGFRSKRRLNAP